MIFTKNKIKIAVLVGLMFLNVGVASAAPGEWVYNAYYSSIQWSQGAYDAAPNCSASCDTSSDSYCAQKPGGNGPCSGTLGMCYAVDVYICEAAPPPAAAPCSYSGPLSWGSGCSAYGSFDAPSGGSASADNSAGGYVGSLTYSCNNGSWSLASQSCAPVSAPDPVYGCTNSAYYPYGNYNSNANASASCSCNGGYHFDGSTCVADAPSEPPAPPPCSYSGPLSWSSCSAYGSFSAPSGGSASADNTTSGYSGSITYSCSNGSWSLASQSCSPTAPSSCDNGATNFPSCNSCPSGQELISGSCQTPTTPASCSNGAVNPTACNQCSGTQVMSGGSCVSCTGGCSGGSCDNGATNPPSCSSFPAPATPAPTVSISLVSSAQQGSVVPMSYSSTNATSCSSAAPLGISSTSGSFANISSILSPGNNTIGITCSGAGGSSTSYASINILVPSVDIMANPMRVRSGNSSTISWSTTDVSSCSVTGPNFSSSALSGSQSRTITAQSLFTITCEGLSDSVTVNIIPLFQEF